MPRVKDPCKDGQVTIALSGTWLDEAETIAAARSEPGMSVSRADVLRMSIRRGLDAMTAEGALEAGLESARRDVATGRPLQAWKSRGRK